ncbi:MAG: hypothetical protein ACSLFI_05220 [Solirubrobacterales bacterium]
MPNGSGGQFIWDAPNGIEIFGTVFTARLNDVNGITTWLLGPSGEFGDVSLDEGQPHDGQQRTTRWTDRSKPRNLIVARLHCPVSSGCSNNEGGPKAYFEVTDAEFKSRDVVKPTASGSGFLWVWSNDWKWHRGDMAYRIDAADTGTGVASTYLLVNGLKVELDSTECSGDRSTYATRFDPCPASAISTDVAHTSAAPFQEGTNVVQFCSSDYAASAGDANQTCTPSRVLFTDNVAPAAPIDLKPVGGNDWRAVNGFDVVWSNPDGQKAEITSADFQVIRNSENQVVESGTATLGTEPALPTLHLPEPGEYRVEVRLRDAAGNLGPSSSTTLRFDDLRPGDVNPEPAAGWVSADELPYEQEIEKAEAGGPSGVGGYAFEVSKSGPVPPCPSGTCQPLEISLNSGADDRVATLSSLSEGNHYVSAVAASGARLSSETVGSSVLQVDKTDPVTTLQGVPGGWVNHPVTLTATATDSGSGMEPVAGDDGEPVTAIRAGSLAPYESPGYRATFTVADEGATRVEYWARDLAGNVNDGLPGTEGEVHAKPSVATVRVDRRPPGVEFVERRDPLDPELIRARVRDTDSGFDSGTISYRQVGGGTEFTKLETGVTGGNLSARLPSDDLPKGKYLIRAETRDRAGNLGDTAIAGSGFTITVPLKAETKLSIGFEKKTRARAVSRNFNETVRVEGRLLSSSGSPIAGADLLVEQRFAVGSKNESGVVRAKTDGTGRFAAGLKPGPSRMIRVSYPGSRTNQRAISRDLNLTMRDRVSFWISPQVLRNGGQVQMTGSIRGKGALRPARGKLVAIQYFDPSRSRWRPVEVLRATRKGSFRYRYRFRTIDFAQRIVFRAVSLPESGWPFSPSTSKPQSVIVYPAGRFGR